MSSKSSGKSVTVGIGQPIAQIHTEQLREGVKVRFSTKGVDKRHHTIMGEAFVTIGQDGVPVIWSRPGTIRPLSIAAPDGTGVTALHHQVDGGVIAAMGFLLPGSDLAMKPGDIRFLPPVQVGLNVGRLPENTTNHWRFQHIRGGFPVDICVGAFSS